MSDELINTIRESGKTYIPKNLDPSLIGHLPDSLYSYFEDISDTNLDRITVLLDFKHFNAHETTATKNFEEALKIRQPDDPLTYLNKAFQILAAKGEIHLICANLSNFEIAKKFLAAAKFLPIKQLSGNAIFAKKRELKKYFANNGKYVFEEAHTTEMIQKIQKFAKDMFKDYNFEIPVDSIFNPYSDYFVCYEADGGRIMSFLRYTWQLPGHFLPCMLAADEESGEHLRLEKPDLNNYGEVFAPLITSASSVKAYKEIAKNFFARCLAINATYLFTTYDRNKPKIREFYNKSFGFVDTGITLKYGTFGGSWGLLRGDRSGMIPRIKEFLEKS